MNSQPAQRNFTREQPRDSGRQPQQRKIQRRMRVRLVFTDEVAPLELMGDPDMPIPVIFDELTGAQNEPWDQAENRDAEKKQVEGSGNPPVIHQTLL